MSFQVMPDLSPAELDDLRESIREHGVLVPIIVALDGTVVDGHHRQRIALELGITYPTRAQDGTEAELRSVAYTANLARRHLSREQHRELVRQSLLTDPELTDREHARRTGVSHPTVAAVRSELEQSGDVEELSTRRDSLGREQPAHKPAAEPQPEPEPEPAPKPNLRLVPKKLPQPARAQDWTDQHQAEDVSASFAGHVNSLFVLAEHPNQRRYLIDQWKTGQIGASPPQRANVTPHNLRLIATGFTLLADEWEAEDIPLLVQEWVRK